MWDGGTLQGVVRSQGIRLKTLEGYGHLLAAYSLPIKSGRFFNWKVSINMALMKKYTCLMISS